MLLRCGEQSSGQILRVTVIDLFFFTLLYDVPYYALSGGCLYKKLHRFELRHSPKAHHSDGQQLQEDDNDSNNACGLLSVFA
jgi:hypothetical protein